LEAGLITMNTEGQVFDFFSDRITIPIYDNNGYLVAFSGRVTTNAEPKYLNTSSGILFSKASVLFNFNKVKNLDTDKIIIVEGFMDVIAFSRAGFSNVVATMGTALSNEQINALQTLDKLQTVILSFDNDVAGKMATISNGQKLMENGFSTYVIGPYDAKIKDVDELFKIHGKDNIAQILNERIDYITFLINHEFQHKKPLDEIQKSINDIINHMIEFGDSSLLLRQQHLKLLADKSGLAFDDLKAKYELDFSKIGIKTKMHGKSGYKPYKPNNEIGLNQKFIEPEKTDLKNIEQIAASDNITQLENENQSLEMRLSDGFNQLILAIVNYPEGFKKVDDAININLTNFPLVQHKFIFKTIQYILNKEEALNESTLIEFLKKRGAEENAIAKSYRSAYEYFINQTNDLMYQSYFKKQLCGNCEQRIDDLINRIQLIKYESTICKTILEI
jgi:DNA primase